MNITTILTKYLKIDNESFTIETILFKFECQKLN